jgi:hypothetical protein
MRHVKISKSEVQTIVSVLDDTRETEYFRSESRPDGRFIQPRRWQDPAVSKAKARIRTARWRNRMDDRRAPTAQQVGVAMVRVLVTSSMDELTRSDFDFIGRTLVELQVRGFSIEETKKTLRKIRNKLVDLADREGEHSDSTGEVISPGSMQDKRLPF